MEHQANTKTQGPKYKMTYACPNIHINKNSVSHASLTHQLPISVVIGNEQVNMNSLRAVFSNIPYVLGVRLLYSARL